MWGTIISEDYGHSNHGIYVLANKEQSAPAAETRRNHKEDAGSPLNKTAALVHSISINSCQNIDSRYTSRPN